MSFTRLTKEEAALRLGALVDAYRQQATAVELPASGYTESQARVDFIDELLLLLGWDVRNEAGKPYSLRDVVVELSTGPDVDGDHGGRPDYILRVDGRPRLVVEAKKPAVNVPDSHPSARQTRRYGYSLALPAAVLTNFTKTAVYDSRVKPTPTDEAHVARLPDGLFDWQAYVDRFDDLWNLLSHEVVASDQYFEVYDYEEEPRGATPVDRHFLRQLRHWRLALGSEIAANQPDLGLDEVGRLTQRLINALLFLRICEDREIEPYRSLSSSLEQGQFHDRLREADETYNAGLFDVLGILPVADVTLRSVIEDLYWPKSRYEFGVLEPEVLAAVYEHFLGERLAKGPDGALILEAKPELLHHGGVVPTPDWVVDKLVGIALDGLPIDALDATEARPRVLDPACGSGAFMLSLYRHLVRVFEPDGERLDLAQRGEVARRFLFGVDIDPEAVEVARLSLLLAILRDEHVDPNIARSVLPDLRGNLQVGNTLIDESYDTLFPDAAADIDRRVAIRPFDWKVSFPQVFSDGGGFDVVVGNPPYARIQVLAEHFPDQLEFFQRPESGFACGQEFNFDQYMLFVERGLRLLQAQGVLAYILPHRFMTSVAGATLRRELLEQTAIERIVHFGHAQIFPGRSTYTCLLRVRKVTQ